MELLLIGPLRVACGDDPPATIGGTRLSGICALLATGRAAGVSLERVVDELWPGAAPSEVAGAVRVNVSRLRSRLGADGTDRIGHEHGRYRLVLGAGDTLDIDAFDEACNAGHLAIREGRWTAAVDRFEEALRWWRGEPFAGVDVPSIDADRARLVRARLDGCDALAVAYSATGAPRLAIELLSPLIDEHPDRERMVAALARAFYLDRRQSEALDVIAKCRTWLREELGLLPCRELQLLERQILDHDEILTTSSEPGEVERRPRTRPSLPPAIVSARGTPMFGRKLEIDAIAEVLKVARTGQAGATITITGPAGIGKTRLLAEAAAVGHQEGYRVFHTWCQPEFGAPLAPFQRGLATAHDPEFEATALAIEAALGVTGDAHRSHGELGPSPVALDVAEQIGCLAESAPTMVALDDAHWADPMTAAVTEHLARSAHPRLVLVLGSRRRTIDAGPSAHHVRLGGLSAAAVAEFIEQLEPDRVDRDDLGLELHRRTAGNPLLLTCLASGGASDSGFDADLLDVAIDRMIVALGPGVHEVVEAASVVASEFDAAVLAPIVGEPTEIVERRLAEGCVGGLLVESAGGGSFAFTHALVRSRVAARIEGDRRRSLHRLASDAIAARDGDGVEVARHAVRAVPDIGPRVAAERAHAAAESALRELSPDVAAEIALEGLGVLDRLGERNSDATVRVQLMSVRAAALERSGRHGEAHDLYDRAVTVALRNGASELAAAVALRASAWGRSLDARDPTLALLERVLAHETELEPATRVRTVATYVHQSSAAEGPSVALEHRFRDAIATVDGNVATSMSLTLAELGLLGGRPGGEDRLRLGRRLALLSRGSVEHPNPSWIRGMVTAGAAALELGRAAAGNAMIRAAVDGALKAREPNLIVVTRTALAGGLQQVGALDEAEVVATEALEFGLANEVGDAMVSYSAFEYMAHFLRGELANLLPIIEQVATAETRAGLAWRAGFGLALAHGGDLERARWVAEEVTDQIEVEPLNVTYPITVAVTAELVAAVGMHDLAARMLPIAEPYSGTFPRMAQVGGSFGPIDRQLALLYRTIGDDGRAEAWFSSALHHCDRSGAGVWRSIVERDAGA